MNIVAHALVSAFVAAGSESHSSPIETPVAEVARRVVPVESFADHRDLVTAPTIQRPPRVPVCLYDANLCYDRSARGLRWSPGRDFMPDIPGMDKHAPVIKRQHILFQYTF